MKYIKIIPGILLAAFLFTACKKSDTKKRASVVTQISAGGDHSIIIKGDNTLWGCGYNEYGQLGDGTKIDKKALVRLTENVKIMSDITIHWC